MFYSEDIIEQVRSENNIVDVIGDYVKLQKKGSSYFGLCPFHNGKITFIFRVTTQADVLLFWMWRRGKCYIFSYEI